MLFGALGVLIAMIAVFEAGSYWHTRAVLGDAAADGVRAAAAWDGSCASGVAVARRAVERQAPGWAAQVEIACVSGPVVTVTVGARTPGLLGQAGGVQARASASAPKEQ